MRDLVIIDSTSNNCTGCAYFEQLPAPEIGGLCRYTPSDLRLVRALNVCIHFRPNIHPANQGGKP